MKHKKEKMPFWKSALQTLSNTPNFL